MVNMLYFLFLGTFGWGISLYLIKILLARQQNLWVCGGSLSPPSW